MSFLRFHAILFQKEGEDNVKQTIYFGGSILTMDRENPRAEALLVTEGKITAVGSCKNLAAMAPDALQEDLQGKTLMPGFVDAHSHLPSMGLALQKCDLMGCTGFEDMLDRIRRFREEKGYTHGEVLQCRGYDPASMKEGEHPTAKLLDSLGFDNPIVCTHQSGHVAVYNSKAMEVCGVDDSFVCPEGGFAGRDEAGHLTGYFEEKAKAPFAPLSSFTDEEYQQGVLEAQEYYLSYGITTAQNGSASGKKSLRLLMQLADAGKLKLDLVNYLDPVPKRPEIFEEIFALCGKGEYRNRMKIAGVKLFLDGSPQARTAWMRKPYENGEPDYCGYGTKTDEWVDKALDNAISHGLQPLAHCNGDAACQQYLDRWEAAVNRHGRGEDLRPIMIHAQTVGMDQLDRMPSLGMHPSFFVGHCWFWGDTHLKNFGKARGMRISPVKAALDRGLVPSLHQDTPVTPPDMLHSVWCAVNRMTKSGVQLDMSYAVTPYEALIAVTNGAAFSYFEEDTKGILKPGAAADLVILDVDPTAVDPMTIKDIRVLRTIKDGKTVFER